MTPGLPSVGQLFWKFRIPAAFTLKALILEAVLRCLTPVTAILLIDRAVGARTTGTITGALIALGLAVVTSLTAGILRDYLYAALESRILEEARQKLYDGLQGFPSPEGILDDFDEIEPAFASAASWGALPLLEALGATALAFWIDWQVGAISFLLWPLVILAPRRPQVADTQRREQGSRIAAILNEALRAQSIIRAFSLEARSASSFRQSNTKLRRLSTKANMLTAFTERFTSSGILLLQMLALTASAWKVHAGQMTPGSLVGLQMLLAMTGGALQYLVDFVPTLAAANLAWQRLREKLEKTKPIPVADTRAVPTLEQEILLSDVEFGALNRISVRIRKGEHVAFVGSSGSGKSAVLRLLMRFDQPDAGTISLDGFNLATADPRSIRTQMGAVLQDNFVFNATLLENIRLGGGDVLAAAKTAGLGELIGTLPDGVETRLGEGGVLLSEANKQRLALARALSRNPGILLLDEISSSLDPADEAAMNKTLREAARGRTVVSATHRLSSTADADVICVLDKGCVVEQGTHFELMGRNGHYAALWRKQAGFRFSTDGRHVDVDAQRLRELPILEKLSEDILAELAPFFATENFPEGREIVRQGDPGDKFYIIVRGKVDVWRSDEKSMVRVAVLEDGDFFGEITLITGFPRTATVRTTTPSTCISLERAQFLRLMERFPELSREISDIAMKRFRASSRALRP